MAKKVPVSRPNRIAASGAWGTVEYAVRTNGRLLAREFVESLPDSDRAKLLQLFQWLADNGQVRNHTKFKHESGKIYAFKQDANDKRQMRLACFRQNNRWILTHGFYKQGSKWRPAEIERAEVIMTEHLALEKEEKESRGKKE